MSEQNKAIVRRYFEEIWSKGNLDVADELVGSGPPTTSGTPMSPEGIKRVVTMFRTAFPDIKYTLQDVIAEGDKVMVYWMANPTHQGEYRSISPTGKKVTYRGFDLYRLDGGKIVERWGLNDDLSLLEQLGAISPPPLRL